MAGNGGGVICGGTEPALAGLSRREAARAFCIPFTTRSVPSACVRFPADFALVSGASSAAVYAVVSAWLIGGLLRKADASFRADGAGGGGGGGRTFGCRRALGVATRASGEASRPGHFGRFFANTWAVSIVANQYSFLRHATPWESSTSSQYQHAC